MSSDLYSILSFSAGSRSVKARVRLHAGHPIFAGHFPGQPVLPGVCQLMIVKELAEKALGRKLFLRHAGQIKFLAMVDPVRVPEFDVEITFNEGSAAQALIREGETTFLKSKCVFTDA